LAVTLSGFTSAPGVLLRDASPQAGLARLRTNPTAKGPGAQPARAELRPSSASGLRRWPFHVGYKEQPAKIIR